MRSKKAHDALGRRHAAEPRGSRFARASKLPPNPKSAPTARQDPPRTTSLRHQRTLSSRLGQIQRKQVGTPSNSIQPLPPRIVHATRNAPRDGVPNDQAGTTRPPHSPIAMHHGKSHTILLLRTTIAATGTRLRSYEWLCMAHGSVGQAGTTRSGAK